ncbi:MAG: phosphoadenosine phosphosulfate reductase family protein [Methanomassiliicoccus sp.]|nr:phosphoadenosine phosphosulfate reductase family protein [Methanomassiliicoccus sp.]
MRLQSLPFEAKVTLTNARIRQFYSLMNGKVYVSFSGGKDSTVLLDMVRAVFPETPAVFDDTGLEFPEIKEFVRSKENVEVIRPEVNFKTVIETYGYPVISKEVAKALDQVRRGCKGKVKHFDGTETGRYDYRRYSYLLDAPFKISPTCCDIMKKRPFKKYGKKTGRRPFIGMLAEESTLRTTQWQLHGCINSTPGIESANPLSFWHESDIWAYIKRHNLELAKPYAMGYERTGCVFCMFGAQCEGYPNRFQRLQRTHPKLYDYCMSERGLNMRPVCEFIHIESADMNARLEDFAEVGA